MALHFPLLINNIEIGMFAAVRRAGGGADPDSINTYDVTIDHNDTRTHLVVSHRYGDGAWVLVRTALDTAGYGPRAQ